MKKFEETCASVQSHKRRRDSGWRAEKGEDESNRGREDVGGEKSGEVEEEGRGSERRK